MASAARKRQVSILDVARVAGVSHQTVSRVLNSPQTVREKNRKAVLDAIALTGYRRNESARALKSAKPNTLGILVRNSRIFGTVNVTWALEQAAARRGYLLKLAIMEGESEPAMREAVNSLLGPDTVALIVVSEQSWIGSVLVNTDVPIVSIGGFPADGVSVVDVDQEAGIVMLMDYLTEGGCQRIDHVAGDQTWYAAQSRLHAWMEYSSDHTIAGRLYMGDWSAESGYECGLRIADDVPDAVLAANDEMAVGVMRALREKGLRIPEDVKVTGFDDERMCAHVSPSLTSVHQNLDEVAKRAIDIVAQAAQSRFASTTAIDADATKTEVNANDIRVNEAPDSAAGGGSAGNNVSSSNVSNDEINNGGSGSSIDAGDEIANADECHTDSVNNNYLREKRIIDDNGTAIRQLIKPWLVIRDSAR